MNDEEYQSVGTSRYMLTVSFLMHLLFVGSASVVSSPNYNVIFFVFVVVVIKMLRD